VAEVVNGFGDRVPGAVKQIVATEDESDGDAFVAGDETEEGLVGDDHAYLAADAPFCRASVVVHG
jgi:hypothetical protein